MYKKGYLGYELKMKCPLCNSANLASFFLDQRHQWQYFECEICFYVFRDPKTYLSPEEEIKRYETHNNSIENKGYVHFLNPVVEKLVPYLKKGDRGLDFGCGPGPILDILFKEKGYKVFNYDPFFTTDSQCLAEPFDFVTCTEAFEHFYSPGQEMEIMSRLLQDQAYLLIMTEFCPAKEGFKDWYYRKDPTHVGFLSQKSLEWVSQFWNYEIIFSNQDRISLLRKKS